MLQVYGSTETSPVAVYTRLSGDWRRPGSTGLPGLVCEARIVDDDGNEVPHGTAGEVVVRGPNVLIEYWNDPKATAETLREGWYHSGDIGVRDADGHFFIHDRKKNLIISGGENIYPAEVERVLGQHPAVAECAVIGRPDEKWQEVPVAYIVAPRWRRGGGRRDRALLPCAAGPLQGAARVRVRGEPAAQRHGQGAALPAQGAVGCGAGRERGGADDGAGAGSGSRFRAVAMVRSPRPVTSRFTVAQQKSRPVGRLVFAWPAAVRTTPQAKRN